jgi:homocitrate synthase
VKARADQLGLELAESQIKTLTQHIKALADEKRLSLSDVDNLLRLWANGHHVETVE